MNKQYRDCRAMIVYDREKAYLPETQELVVEHRLKENVAQLKKEISEAEEENKSSKEINVMKVKLYALKLDLQLFKNEETKERPRTYVLQCTHNECKGMLCNENRNDKGNYECAVCAGITCSKCKMELHEDEHECDTDILATVSMMERSSKPCPKCSARIHKISGCNQMFCTICKCVFGWSNLKIETGFMHNPHYLEWRRQNREAGIEEEVDNQNFECRQMHGEYGIYLERKINERVKDYSYNLHHSFTAYWEQQPDEPRLIYGWYVARMVRNAVHHREVTIPRLNANQNNVNTNRELRLKLLLNQISEDDFIKMIQRRDKRSQSDNEFALILTTLVEGLNDIVAKSMSSSAEQTPEKLFSMIQNISELEQYINKCLLDVCKVYGIQPKTIVHYF